MGEGGLGVGGRRRERRRQRRGYLLIRFRIFVDRVIGYEGYVVLVFVKSVCSGGVGPISEGSSADQVDIAGRAELGSVPPLDGERNSRHRSEGGKTRSSSTTTQRERALD